jgi:uncharacterized protein YdbL (DUF1318 family)
MNRKFIPFLIALMLGGILASPLHADAESDAADRIRMRLSQIDELKSAGQVGENSAGYLVERETLGPRQSSIVAAENDDRRIIYKSVAGKTSQTMDEVGEQRALQIASRARSGVWLQRPSGEWYQKS